MIPFPTLGPVMIGMCIALAASIGANVLLTHAYLGQRDDTAAAQAQANQANAAAAQCSTAVDALQETAQIRRQAADKARTEAKVLATTHAQRADQVLATPPSTPGDDCKSARDRVDAWWAARGKP
jgi:hypothetical protein